MRWSRACVSTWIVTSSGIASVVDEAAHEVEVGLARRREPDLDLLVAHAHEQVEHDALALGAHRVDEGLVAVAQVDGAPARCLRRCAWTATCDRAVRRGSARGTDGTGGRASPRASGCSAWVLFSLVRMCFSRRRTPQRGRPGLGLAAAAKEKQAVKHGSRLTPRALGRAIMTSERMSPPGHPLARRPFASRARSSATRPRGRPPARPASRAVPGRSTRRS